MPEAAGGNEFVYPLTFTFAALNFSRIVARRGEDFKNVIAIVAFIFIDRHLYISNALFYPGPFYLQG